ncbi:MAG TPA: iron-containing alcohol dehydrogenase [Pyrodictium sp.]|nr:iron-containing alcohol dehydrogenase [Pyrodictium sp.]
MLNGDIVNEYKVVVNGVQVHYGVNALENIDTTMFRGLRWFIVTSRGGSMEKYGWIAKLAEIAERAGAWLEVCKCVSTNPTVEQADEAYENAKRFKATVIIGFGGGSSIDVAKAVAAGLASHAPPSKLYRREASIKGSLPIVAIPSTHGTGSEVDRFAVLSDDKTRSKAAIVSTKIRPVYAILDPRITVTLPPRLSGATVIDALSHALESFVARNANPVSRCYAREAVHLIAKGISELKESSWEELHVRAYFLNAAMLAGAAIDISRTTLVHALEHPISYYHPEIHHGIGLAALLPAWIEYIEGVVPELVEEIIKPLQKVVGGQTASQTIKNVIETLIGEIVTLEKLGVSENEYKIIAEDAMRYLKALVLNNPRQPKDVNEIVELLQKASSG